MINPEPWRINGGWHQTGRINFAAISETGNVEKELVDIDINIVVRDRKNRFTLVGECAFDGLLDPPCGIGAELTAF